MSEINATQVRFGYPATLVRDYAHWSVVVRPEQVTLGSLVLVCKDPARAFSEITPAAFAELARVTHDVEAVLKAVWNWQKINYLMLMMNDPDVHFHVFPRYDRTLSFAGLDFPDSGWPRAPDMGKAVKPDGPAVARIVAHLKSAWPVA